MHVLSLVTMEKIFVERKTFELLWGKEGVIEVLKISERNRTVVR